MIQGLKSWFADRTFRIAFDHRSILDSYKLPWKIRKIQEKTREFADREIRPRALQYDAKTPDQFDWEIVRIGAREGFLGIFLPTKFGGSLSYPLLRYGILATAVMMEELCRACSGIGLIFGAHGLGIAPIFLSLDRRLWNLSLIHI